ncbi:MAG: dimethyl sulfoxide reductase anchor subunit [Fibrobacteria bacterium]|nr:dimethyl sulfoxide reductase anchor subunit [Fibrobacteria bacterium]
MSTSTLQRRKATLEDLDPAVAEEIRSTLSRQDDLTAVERFSQWHSRSETPALEPLYRELLPATPPEPDEQYAFEVDLDRCSSCKACVVACHTLNGLDETESWRTVGTLLGDDRAAQVTVTSSCHHCEDPGCAAGCPTLAYEKDAKTGIVHHLDDQCMGCQYCLWTCPYDAPKWNERLGIVRKCDMCRSRLSAGEAPACVQACPSQAIRIRTVSRQEVRTEPSRGTALPGIVPPESTMPQTRYLGSIPEGIRPAHLDSPKPEHAHAPLAVLLVLTQWATGLWLFSTVWSMAPSPAHPWTRPIGLALLVSGLVIGSAHLGRPERAWKAFLGWRRSWFSREVLAFGNAVPLALAALVPAWLLPWFPREGAAAAATAMMSIGVVCSAMLYIATPRAAWSRPATAIRFGLTVIGGGSVVLASLGGPDIRLFGILSVASGLAKGLLVLSDRRRLESPVQALRTQAILLAGPLSSHARGQFLLFVAAVALAALGTVLASPVLFAGAVALRLASDLAERLLFFRACPATRMPGGIGR